jgi:hypothetical protein
VSARQLALAAVAGLALLGTGGAAGAALRRAADPPSIVQPGPSAPANAPEGSAPPTEAPTPAVAPSRVAPAGGIVPPVDLRPFGPGVDLNPFHQQ